MPTNNFSSLTKQTSASSAEITPELAAQIVKNYILPMFESQEKREMKHKYNKMAGIASAKKFKQEVGTKSVYGELKLSEKLSFELNKVKDQVVSLME